MWSGQMIESLSVTIEELAILCAVVSGQRATAKTKPALDRLIANGFVERAKGRSFARYRQTAKTDLLFTQLCTGISGG
jgi:hypothetical protein